MWSSLRRVLWKKNLKRRYNVFCKKGIFQKTVNNNVQSAGRTTKVIILIILGAPYGHWAKPELDHPIHSLLEHCALWLLSWPLIWCNNWKFLWAKPRLPSLNQCIAKLALRSLCLRGKLSSLTSHYSSGCAEFHVWQGNNANWRWKTHIMTLYTRLLIPSFFFFIFVLVLWKEP